MECSKDSVIRNQSRFIASIAEEALIVEAVLSPKPGLVDAIDSGAHTDMDIFLFLKSARCFRPYFEQFVYLGGTDCGATEDLLPKIRKIGIQAEQEMFLTTSGVNTHKGILFSMGIVLTAYGVQIRDRESLSAQDTESVLEIVKQITAGLIERELENLPLNKKRSNGEALYLKYGMTGIRGEVENGFPILSKKVLPYLRKSQSESTRDRLLTSLFLLMTETEDSNIVHRSNWRTLLEVQQDATRFLKNGGMNQPNALQQIAILNSNFIEKNISPGGSADLLSVAFLLAKMERII